MFSDTPFTGDSAEPAWLTLMFTSVEAPKFGIHMAYPGLLGEPAWNPSTWTR